MSNKKQMRSSVTKEEVSYAKEFQLPYYLLVNRLTADNMSKSLTEFMAFLKSNAAIEKIYINALQSHNQGLHKQSVFYAEKLFCLAQSKQKSVEMCLYLWAFCLYNNNEYQAAINILQTSRQISGDFGMLLGRCLLHGKQYEETLEFLENDNSDQATLIKAQCFEALENKKESIHNYCMSLRKNPSNVSLLGKLVDSFLITQAEKQQIYSQLNFHEDEAWLQQYCGSICKARCDVRDPIYQQLSQRNNLDLLCVEAKTAYYQYDIPSAYDFCQKILTQNAMFFDIIPIYTACLVELERVSELYNCAHKLIDNYASNALSWLAVGNYYYLTKKYEIARKHYQRAIQIDQNLVHAWIGLAHSYAIQDESDQAMSIYRSISRQFPGCYQAHIYIGMEYLRTNNLKTAYQSFQTALEINPYDPMIYNEIGVIQFKQKNYASAKEMFQKTLETCQNQHFRVQETALQNLGQCMRKLKAYREALKLFEQCIQISLNSPQAFFGLAFTYHISDMPNSLNKAIQYYHKSLSLKPEQPFVQEMLVKALNEAAEAGFQEYSLDQ